MIDEFCTVKELLEKVPQIKSKTEMVFVDDDPKSTNSIKLLTEEDNSEIITNLDNYFLNTSYDDDNLTFNNGEYELDLDKIFNKYSNYWMTLVIPSIDNESVLDGFYEELVEEESNIKLVEKILTVANSVKLVVRKNKNFDIKNNFHVPIVPKVKSSICGFALFDVAFLETPTVIDGTLTEINSVPIFLAMIDNELDLLDFVKKRKKQYTMKLKIKNGKPMKTGKIIYYTDENGNISDATSIEVEE